MLTLVRDFVELNTKVTRTEKSESSGKTKRFLVWWRNSLIEVEIYVYQISIWSVSKRLS